MKSFIDLPAGCLAALIDEGPVYAILSHQLFMGAPLDDFAMVDHQDLISSSERSASSIE